MTKNMVGNKKSKKQRKEEEGRSIEDSPLLIFPLPPFTSAAASCTFLVCHHLVLCDAVKFSCKHAMVSKKTFLCRIASCIFLEGARG